MVTRSIENAQKKVEGHNFDIRKHLLDFDNVMNQQRTIVYGMRKNILRNQNIDQTVLDHLADVTSGILDTYVPQGVKKENWNLQGLSVSLSQQFGIQIDFKTLPTIDEEVVTKKVSESVKLVFDQQKQKLGPFFSQLEKMVLLQSIDQRWKEHLAVIDKVKEGINLRGYAQKDPIIEYKKEAFRAFENLMHAIKTDTIEKLLKVQIVNQEQAEQMQDMLHKPELDELEFHGADESSSTGGFNSLQASADHPPPATNRVRMGAPPPERSMNRAERRRLEKSKR
jgi:preprotein translocase subunit SecA